jgi:hypothetical protein
MGRPALAGCAVALALAAGCGGDGGAGGFSREEFVAELDRICADFNAKQEEIGEPESLQDVAELGPQVEREFDSAVEHIRDLGEPPEEIEGAVDRFLEIADEQRRLLGEIVLAAEENDLERAQEVAEQGEELNDEADEIADELGAESCAEDLATG